MVLTGYIQERRILGFYLQWSKERVSALGRIHQVTNYNKAARILIHLNITN